MNAYALEQAGKALGRSELLLRFGISCVLAVLLLAFLAWLTFRTDHSARKRHRDPTVRGFRNRITSIRGTGPFRRDRDDDDDQQSN